jgi:hypothetical protein
MDAACVKSLVCPSSVHMVMFSKEVLRCLTDQNLSVMGGPWGNLARFSPMLFTSDPKRELPPNAGTPMLAGIVQLQSIQHHLIQHEDCISPPILSYRLPFFYGISQI